MRTKMIFAWLLGLLGAFILPLPADAEEGDTLWTRTYGGYYDDYAYSVQETTDGGFILAGYTQSFGAGFRDAYLIKTNAAGDTAWTRTYGGDFWDYIESVQQTQDGGYILAGTSESYSPGFDSEIYVIKTDSTGDTLWTHTYGGPYNIYGHCIRQTQEGGYIIVGERGMYISGNTDLYLIKTNSSGDTTWTKTIGATEYDCGYCVEPISGGYIISGVARPSGSGNNDVYLVKCNSSGNVMWEKTYGGTGAEEGLSVQQTGDGGFIIAGHTSSLGTGTVDAWLLKTDSFGDTLWTRTFGDASGSDNFYSVDQVQDGGYILVGSTSSWGDPYRNVYLVKTNGSGDLQWYRTYGGDANEDGYGVQQISDGSYILAGETSSWGPGEHSAWLFKVEGPASGIEPRPQIQLLQPVFFAPHPDPFNGMTIIRFELPTASWVTLEVYDIHGRVVSGSGTTPTTYEAGVHQITFEGTNLPSGIYFAKLTAGDYIGMQKLVLLK